MSAGVEVLEPAVQLSASVGAVLTDHVYPIVGLVLAGVTLAVVINLDKKARDAEKARIASETLRVTREREMLLPTLLREETDSEVLRALLREGEASTSSNIRRASQRAFWLRPETSLPTVDEVMTLESGVAKFIAEHLDAKYSVPEMDSLRAVEKFALACIDGSQVDAGCRAIEWWVKNSARLGSIDRKPIPQILDTSKPGALKSLLYTAHSSRRDCPSVYFDVLGEVVLWMVTMCNARPSMPAGNTRVPSHEELKVLRTDPRCMDMLRSFLATWVNLEPNGGMDDFWTLDEDDSAFRRSEIAAQVMAVCSIAAPLEPHYGTRALQRAHLWKERFASGDFDDAVYVDLARREFSALVPMNWEHFSF